MSQFVSFQGNVFMRMFFSIYHGFMSMFFPIYHGFMSMFSSIMDLWACFHLSWIYENAFIHHGFMRMFFFIYHGFMSMFSSIMDLWAYFHISWIYEHAFTYYGFMSIFSSIIFYPLIHKFNLHMWQIVPWEKKKDFCYDNVFICHFVPAPWYIHFAHTTICIRPSCLFYDANNEQKFGGPSVWHPQRTQKQKTDVQSHILFKLLKRPRLTSLNFLSQLSFWSKDVKTCTNFSSVSGDHLTRV
jgi:hypothetical protein